VRIAVTLMIVASAAGGCARRSDPALSSRGEDDDAFCRAKGLSAGSNEYVACRKDRDAQKSDPNARAERAHRNLTDLMISTPAGADPMRR
jgi:hypothetical protein